MQWSDQNGDQTRCPVRGKLLLQLVLDCGLWILKRYWEEVPGWWIVKTLGKYFAGLWIVKMLGKGMHHDLTIGDPHPVETVNTRLAKFTQVDNLG